MSVSAVTLDVDGALRTDFLEPLSRLQKVEANLVSGATAREFPYIHQKFYLVRANQLLPALPRALQNRPLAPMLKLRNVARLTRQLLLGRTEYVTSDASLIEARPHWKVSGVFRSYYTTSRSTIKAAIQSPTGRARVKRELSARQVIENIGVLTVPRLLGHDASEDYLALHEQWVEGRPFRRYRDIPVLCERLLPQLCRHYQTYGIHELPLQTVVKTGFASRVAEASQLIRWASTWVAKSTFLTTLEKMENAQLNLPVSFCHGDLIIGHVLIDNQGSPILIDLDRARERPIALDLADLNRCLRPYSKRLVQASLDLLQTCSTPNSYSPIAQLLIMSLRVAANHQQLAESYAKVGSTEMFRPQLFRVFRSAQWLLRQHLL